jgi:GNAT superfamily N-acetyltransferase
LPLATNAIDELSARDIDRNVDGLVALLDDAVAGGASIGFVAPLAEGELEAFWREIALDVEDGVRNVFTASEGGRIVGSVQLAPSGKSNQRHRAEVQKLLVLSSARGRGIGAALMRAAEERAAAMGRWLLTLDTREASDADRLYRRWGWTAVGTIPEYAADPDRSLAGCVFFYKRIAP